MTRDPSMKLTTVIGAVMIAIDCPQCGHTHVVEGLAIAAGERMVCEKCRKIYRLHRLTALLGRRVRQVTVNLAERRPA